MLQTTTPMSRKKKIRKLWTTGQISDLVGVNAKKVVCWIDSGELRGVKLPELDERRVHRDELRVFLNKYEFIWAIRELDIEEGVITSPAAKTPEVLPPPPKAAKRNKPK